MEPNALTAPGHGGMGTLTLGLGGQDWWEQLAQLEQQVLSALHQYGLWMRAWEPAVTALGQGCQKKTITLTFRRIFEAGSENEFTFLSSLREIRFLLMLGSHVFYTQSWFEGTAAFHENILTRMTWTNQKTCFLFQPLCGLVSSSELTF